MTHDKFLSKTLETAVKKEEPTLSFLNVYTDREWTAMVAVSEVDGIRTYTFRQEPGELSAEYILHAIRSENKDLFEALNGVYEIGDWFNPIAFQLIARLTLESEKKDPGAAVILTNISEREIEEHGCSIELLKRLEEMNLPKEIEEYQKSKEGGK